MLRFLEHDTGIGIKQSHLDSIFDSFSQGEAALEDGRMGTGLGLSITRQLTSMMNGRIWVKSKLGAGSKFTFEVPLALPDEKERIADSGITCVSVFGESTSPAGFTILAVDDNPLNRVYIQKILEAHGHTVLLAEDGEKALSLLQSRCVEIIFMDVQMPVMNGIEATVQIRTRSDLAVAADVPIVAVTAFTVEGDRERFLRAGMNYYVSKPLQAQSLLNVLDEVFRASLPLGGSDVAVSRKVHEAQDRAASGEFEHREEALVLLDKEKAMEAMAGNARLFTILCTSFLQESVDKEESLTQAVSSHDWKAAMVAAHAVKNSAGLLCAKALQEIAEQIETDCRMIVEAHGGSTDSIEPVAQAYSVEKKQSDAITIAVANFTVIMAQTRDAIADAIQESECG
jgi:CheY-like chemotaxis protein